MMIRPACSTMKRRPEPSGASHIQSGRSRVMAGKAGRSCTFGSGWAEAVSVAAATRRLSPHEKERFKYDHKFPERVEVKLPLASFQIPIPADVSRRFVPRRLFERQSLEFAMIDLAGAQFGNVAHDI